MRRDAILGTYPLSVAVNIIMPISLYFHGVRCKGGAPAVPLFYVLVYNEADRLPYADGAGRASLLQAVGRILAKAPPIT